MISKVEELRTRLLTTEQLCEELVEENETYKNEVKNMENEVEEMQDNFR